MRKIITTLFAALAFTALAQPTIITSIHPLYDLTRQVAGEHANVVRVLPPGASPHTFDPTPRDVARIAQADAIILIGGYGIDAWLTDLVEASGGSAPIVTLFDIIDFEAIETDHDDHAGEEEAMHHDEHGAEHDDHTDDHAGEDEHAHDDEHNDEHGDEAEHAHGPANSHIWLDPVLMIQAVPAIVETLSEADPANADTYHANGDALIGHLQALHEELHDMLEPIEGKAFVPFHDAWPYFAQRYGLDLVVSIEPFPGREPSPAYLQHALELIERSGAQAIFTEPQLSRRPAEIVAESAGVPLYTLDPLGGTPETETYQDLLRYNAVVVLEALSE